MSRVAGNAGYFFGTSRRILPFAPSHRRTDAFLYSLREALGGEYDQNLAVRQANHVMRTPLFLLAGFLLVSASFILGKLFLETYPRAGTWAASFFILVWLALAAVNLIAGVTRAGYTVAEELPIFLLIFVLPTACMLFLRWKFL